MELTADLKGKLKTFLFGWNMNRNKRHFQETGSKGLTPEYGYFPAYVEQLITKNILNNKSCRRPKQGGIRAKKRRLADIL